MFSTIKMSSYFRIVLLILLAIVKKDDKLEGSADIVFFCHDDDRGVVADGKYYAAIADSLREE